MKKFLLLIALIFSFAFEADAAAPPLDATSMVICAIVNYSHSIGGPIMTVVIIGAALLAAVVLKVNRKIDVAVNKYLKFVWAYLFTAMLLLYRSSFRAILLSKQSTVSY